MYPRISRYISAAIVSLFLSLPLYAQEEQVEPMEQEEQTGQEKVKEMVEDLTEKDPPVFGGVTVTGDVVGVVMKLLGSNYSQMEVAARLNFKERYFPVFELGYGESDNKGEETGNRFRTHAPYFRVGVDYNFNTRKWQTGNRYYLGVRYAFTSFEYDLNVEGFADPVWGIPVPFDYKGLSANSHWGEVVFGIEAKMWGFFRLGWNVRYKIRISHSEVAERTPWYVPGFGKYGNSCIGGTFNIIFDI